MDEKTKNKIYTVIFIAMLVFVIIGAIVYTSLEALSADDKIQRIFINSVSVGSICFCSVLLILCISSYIYNFIKNKKIMR